MKIKPIFLLFSTFLVIGLAAAGCGSGAPCDLPCPEGQSCLIVDGNQQCVDDGNGDSCGPGGIGDACDSDTDCDCGLSCTSGVEGVLSCQP